MGGAAGAGAAGAAGAIGAAETGADVAGVTSTGGGVGATGVALGFAELVLAPEAAGDEAALAVDEVCIKVLMTPSDTPCLWR